MPATMHSFYLRNMYHGNRLAVPGGISLAGVPIDLRRIETPTFILSTREDHIAPWHSTYAATRLYRGQVEFVLADSGHIAGTISPLAANTAAGKTRTSPRRRLNGSKPQAGTVLLVADIGRNGYQGAPGGRPEDNQPGGRLVQPIEDAPGSYVRTRVVN